MIKVKVKGESIKLDSNHLRKGNIEDYLDEATYAIDALVIAAMDTASKKSDPVYERLVTGVAIAKIFDEAIKICNEYVEDDIGKALNLPKTQVIDIEVNLDDIDEIRRQAREMNDEEGDDKE